MSSSVYVSCSLSDPLRHYLGSRFALHLKERKACQKKVSHHIMSRGSTDIQAYVGKDTMLTNFRSVPFDIKEEGSFYPLVCVLGTSPKGLTSPCFGNFHKISYFRNHRDIFGVENLVSRSII